MPSASPPGDGTGGHPSPGFTTADTLSPPQDAPRSPGLKGDAGLKGPQPPVVAIPGSSVEVLAAGPAPAISAPHDQLPEGGSLAHAPVVGTCAVELAPRVARARAPAHGGAGSPHSRVCSGSRKAVTAAAGFRPGISPAESRPPRRV